MRARSCQPRAAERGSDARRCSDRKSFAGVADPLRSHPDGGRVRHAGLRPQATAGGFLEQQAEVQAEALAAVVTETLATKQDLRELEYRLTLRLGVMTVAVGAVAALVKLA